MKSRISGTVVDAVRGEVLPDIEVSIRVNRAENALQSVVTGSDGRFEFGDLATAKYSLSARGHGYLPQAYQQHHGLATAVVTGPGFESENLIFGLKRDASISGTVTDGVGAPVSLAEVLLFTSLPALTQVVRLRSKQKTDDAGQFQFSHLTEGKYYLAVSAHPWYARDDSEEAEGSTSLEGERGLAIEESAQPKEAVSSRGAPMHSELDVAFQTRYYVNATEPELATPIVLKPADRATADLHLVAVPAIRLKIRGEPGFKHTADPLVLHERIFSYSRQVVSQSFDQDGAELDSLAPGRYRLELPSQGAGGLPQQQMIDLVADAEVIPGESSKSVSSVTGNVLLDGTEVSCQRCNIQLLSLPSGEAFVARKTPKGFEIDGGVRPGVYFVLALSPEDDYWVKEISAVGARVFGKQVEIQSGAPVRLSIVMTKNAGTVDGLALRGGKPVSQAAVFLVPNDPAHNLDRFRFDQSDSDGSFTFRRILPGDYTAFAVAEGWDLEWTNPATLGPYLGGGVRVRVQPGNKIRLELTVQLLAGVSN
ncbi:MAG: carboxypeptidase regulatory-like domain-containing protein [Acidobacteria bacterium]|nr:carboxypeptidase regulatory-like domain-containing protein [Acidobacteriota bacterium]